MLLLVPLMRMPPPSPAPAEPPTPPPAVNLPDWRRTLDEIGRIGPERFGATHFGLHEDVEARRVQLQERLDAQLLYRVEGAPIMRHTTHAVYRLRGPRQGLIAEVLEIFDGAA